MKERRKVDQNQKNRMVRIYISVFGIGVIVVGMIAAGAVKWNTINTNKVEIETIEVIARDNRENIVRFEERFDDIDDALKRIEDKIK